MKLLLYFETRQNLYLEQFYWNKPIGHLIKKKKVIRKELTRAQTIYQTTQIFKFSNITYFLYFNSSDDEPTRMAQAADRMKRTRDSNNLL